MYQLGITAYEGCKTDFERMSRTLFSQNVFLGGVYRFDERVLRGTFLRVLRLCALCTTARGESRWGQSRNKTPTFRSVCCLAHLRVTRTDSTCIPCICHEHRKSSLWNGPVEEFTLTCGWPKSQSIQPGDQSDTKAYLVAGSRLTLSCIADNRFSSCPVCSSMCRSVSIPGRSSLGIPSTGR